MSSLEKFNEFAPVLLSPLESTVPGTWYQVQVPGTRYQVPSVSPKISDKIYSSHGFLFGFGV